MRTLLTGFAALGLLLTSCQKDEQVNSPEGNKDVINFTAGTTRAAISDVNTMMADPTGFKVYARNSASMTNWYNGVDGTANYRYSLLSWGWSSGAPQWPTTPAGYPLNFYAYYPASATGFSTTVTPAIVLTGTVAVQSAPAAQTDFLASTATAATKPIDGKLNMTFTHIMSKIDFAVVAGAGLVVDIQALTANNLKNTGTYNYLTSSWGAGTGSDTYVYFGTYYPSGTGGVLPIVTYKPLIADESTANPFYLTPHSNHLMLLPQTTPTWDKSTTVANAYIGVIYRISTLLQPNMVGYTTAVSHPNYAGGLYVGPLFVKVGFPFADSNLVWDKSKGYTYNLMLGTLNATNGYLVDTFYYDDKGNRTTYPVVGKSIGDPVTGGTINFNVVVTPWADDPAVPVN